MEPNLTFIDQVSELSRQNVRRCYYCLRCTAGCPAAYAMGAGPAQMLKMVQLGRRTPCSVRQASGCASAARRAAPAVPTRSTPGR